MITPNDFVRLDKAIDKVLAENPDIIEEGRKELDELLREGITDDALIFWRGDSYAQAYYQTKQNGESDKRMLERAIADYNRLVASGHYEHLRPKLAEWKKELNIQDLS